MTGQALTKSKLSCSALQAVHGPRRVEREAQAEAHPDHLHQRATEGAGEGLRRDPLPGHLHARGAGAQDRPDRSQSAGLVPEPTCQVPQAGARRLSSSGRRQVQFGQEVGPAGRRQQRRQIHRPGQHGGPQPAAHLQLRRAQPHRRAGERRRWRRQRRTVGGRQGRRVVRHGGGRGGDGVEPRLGLRPGDHHLHPGLAGRPVRQRAVVLAETERSQGRLSKKRHVLIDLHTAEMTLMVADI
ncbi:paired like homeobox 2Bb isoform X2 [Festucalex cinctus]